MARTDDDCARTAVCHTVSLVSCKSLDEVWSQASRLDFDFSFFMSQVDRLCLLESEQYLNEEKKEEVESLIVVCFELTRKLATEFGVTLSNPRLWLADLISFYNWVVDTGVSHPIDARYLLESPLGFKMPCPKIK